MNNTFDPNDVGIANGNFFGFPTLEDAPMLLLGVPWDVSTSYGGGTHRGPQAILEASPQLDFHDFTFENAWRYGHQTQMLDALLDTNQSMRQRAKEIIDCLEAGQALDKGLQQQLDEVNSACAQMVERVKQASSEALNEGQLVGLVGGDHSTPLGLIQALAERYPKFGVLHIDAHADLRESYEGFEYSHASIMHNALKLPQIASLVSVGLRDISPEERARIAADPRIIGFFDYDLKKNNFFGELWSQQCKSIVEQLPDLVYVSFDIDGLDPSLCPHTGTPVAGGLSMNEAYFLLEQLVASGKRIIGFDLNEVNPGSDEWDANVGARLLYKLRNAMAISNRLPFTFD